MFQSERSSLAAYNKLKSELSSARSMQMLCFLFTRFAEAPAFLMNQKKGKEYTDFLTLWVEDALIQQDDEIRLLYSDFYYKIRPGGLGWRRFGMKKNNIRPGDSIVLVSHSFRQDKAGREKYFVKLERLSLDEPNGVGRYQVWDEKILEPAGRIYRYVRRVDSQGVSLGRALGGMDLFHHAEQVSYLCIYRCLAEFDTVDGVTVELLLRGVPAYTAEGLNCLHPDGLSRIRT